MDIGPIRNDADHAWALEAIDVLWSAEAGPPEAGTPEVLITLVDVYEAKPPSPIIFRVEQQGLSRTELIPMIGSRAPVSESRHQRPSPRIHPQARKEETP